MFNDRFGLTQSVLDGRKTQTRRIVPPSVIEKYAMLEDSTIIDDARYDVGEVVAVAQAYHDCGGLNEEGVPRWDIIAQTVGATSLGWGNKMFVAPELMPHRVRITEVRVQRLQDISDEDCLKEGIEKMITGCEYYQYSFYDNDKSLWHNDKTPREAFARLIDKVSGKGTWDSNPYVFVYDFELIK